ncbi:MAG TPA: hypothetical protein VF175_12750 [Lacipirellula sp.]
MADHAAGLLWDAVAEAVVEDAFHDSPMLLCPEANQRYRWNWLARPTPV